MRQLEIYSSSDLKAGQRSRSALFLCDESSITCKTFRELQEKIITSGLEVVLGIPDNQYKKGSRGWAKAQILASVTDNLRAIMPVNFEAATQELEKDWAYILVRDTPTWSKVETMTAQKESSAQSEVVETTDAFDREMINRVKEFVTKSNCWFDPAGCAFVKDGTILMESVSTSFNDSRCGEIPIDFRELPLDSGQRMIFCDSLHAERVGVSEASKKGISLAGSTVYLTKFPCRSCALSLVNAGVEEIVFEEDSYGLVEVGNLFTLSNVSIKRISQLLE